MARVRHSGISMTSLWSVSSTAQTASVRVLPDGHRSMDGMSCRSGKKLNWMDIIEYQDNFGTDVTQLYQAAGAIVLEHQYRDITVKGQSLRIGGIYGYCLPDKYLETEEADLSECMFLWDFENTDRYKILLSHLPIAWLKNDALEEWNMDCVFSGHLHGGQVILPGIGGVYAPDMGWFPGRLKGVFDSKDGKRHLVLSAGLGNTEVIPRFNNIPEIVCVDLVPEGGW